MSEALELDVKVRPYGGTYIARCNGVQASCTMSAAHAVRAVVLKAARNLQALGVIKAVPAESTIECRELSRGFWKAVLPETARTPAVKQAVGVMTTPQLRRVKREVAALPPNDPLSSFRRVRGTSRRPARSPAEKNAAAVRMSEALPSSLGKTDVLRMKREGWRFGTFGGAARVNNGWLIMASDPRGNYVPVLLADPDDEPEKWADDLGPRAEEGQLVLL